MAQLKAGTKVDGRIPADKINHKHEIHVLMNLGEYSTTNTAYEDVSASEIYFNLANFYGYDIYFEANLAYLLGTGAWVRLWDIGNSVVLAEFNQTNGGGYNFTRFRSGAITGVYATQLKVQIKAEGTSSSAYVKAARLVLVPQ